MRRSLRIRNRRSNIHETPGYGRASESMPNLHHMGGNGNQNNNEFGDINFNIMDFMHGNQEDLSFNGNNGVPRHVPNERGDGLLHQGFVGREARSNRFNYLAFKIPEIIVVIIVTITVLLIFEMYFSSIRRSQETFMKNKYDKLMFKTNRLAKINDKMNYLNKKLSYLNKSLGETTKWRDTMMTEIERMKKVAEMTSGQLGGINLKIEEALTLYDADKIALIDYALESAGGYVTSIPDTTPIPSRFTYDIMGIAIVHYPSDPRLLIQPGTLPGQCFAFKGNAGRIRIRLARRVQITAVTLEHVYAHLVPDMSSAPKDFKVYGLNRENDEIRIDLGIFIYSLNSKALQMFHILNLNKTNTYRDVELEILTNYGNPNYTCVYRFRVHGNMPCEDEIIL